MSYKRKENYEASMLGIAISLVIAGVLILVLGIIKLFTL
jgi:hypothetical protein